MKLIFLNQFFTDCWWWILFWMFLAFLLGWLLRKLFGSNDNKSNELDDCRERYKMLEDKYNKLLLENNSKQNFTDTKKETNKETSGFVDNNNQAKQSKPSSVSPYSKLKNDNLQIVEGIGPKMEEILKKNGINTWADLASKKHDDLRKILDEENPTRYRIINPETWPEQAKLAHEGKWDKLIEVQKYLDGGKTNTSGATDSKLEKIMVKMGLLKRWKKDDLKAIEGIGPKIDKLLKDAGISTWKKLSETPVEKIQEILSKAGKNYKLADPKTWPKQAKLADENKWDELQEYQDYLIGGR